MAEIGRHARPEATDWAHYTHESHLAVSLAFERFAEKLRAMGFNEAANMAVEESHQSWQRAELIKVERQEAIGGSAGPSAPTVALQEVPRQTT